MITIMIKWGEGEIKISKQTHTVTLKSALTTVICTREVRYEVKGGTTTSVGRRTLLLMEHTRFQCNKNPIRSSFSACFRNTPTYFMLTCSVLGHVHPTLPRTALLLPFTPNVRTRCPLIQRVICNDIIRLIIKELTDYYNYAAL